MYDGRVSPMLLCGLSMLLIKSAKCGSRIHKCAMMRHTWTDQVCGRSKTAVQWPDRGAMHRLASLLSPNFCY